MMEKVFEGGIVYYTIVKKDDLPIGNDTKKARYVLGMMLNYFNMDCCEIIVSDHGKPYFKDLDVYFNYSHSKSYIACAISSCDVGIDIEDADRIISDRVSKKYLGGEKNIKKWVQKEAYSKLEGLGISIIKNIDLDNISSESMVISNDSYVCCICSDSGVFEKIEFI